VGDVACSCRKTVVFRKEDCAMNSEQSLSEGHSVRQFDPGKPELALLKQEAIKERVRLLRPLGHLKSYEFDIECRYVRLYGAIQTVRIDFIEFETIINTPKGIIDYENGVFNLYSLFRYSALTINYQDILESLYDGDIPIMIKYFYYHDPTAMSVGDGSDMVSTEKEIAHNYSENSHEEDVLTDRLRMTILIEVGKTYLSKKGPITGPPVNRLWKPQIIRVKSEKEESEDSDSKKETSFYDPEGEEIDPKYRTDNHENGKEASTTASLQKDRVIESETWSPRTKLKGLMSHSPPL